MTSISPAPAQDSLKVSSQSGRAGSPSAAGSAIPIALPPASQLSRSYANATATQAANPASTSATGDQHALSSSVSNKGPSAMATPTAVNTATPNGTPALGEHGRKPSVTISAAGSSGYVPNGAPIAPASQRAQISFGQFNNATDGAAAPVDSSSHPAQASLSAAPGNPRITTPAKSPSPIPQPAASGGRPPSGFQSQNGPPHFGSMSGPQNGVVPPAVASPQGPGAIPQPTHLRRQSSQQSDASNQGPPFTPGGGANRNQFMRNNNNRNPGFGQGGYPQQQQMPYSPGPNYRQMPGQQRPGQGYPPQFPNQQGMPFTNSPHPPRSPGFPGSQPGTPSMQHQQMAPNQMYAGYQNAMGPPSYGQYQQHPGNHGQAFGHQAAFNPEYNYYQAPYQMHPSYLGQGPPQSPGPFRQAPPSAQQQYRQGQFNQASQPMSRSPSHASTDRPGSSLGVGAQQPPQSQTPVGNVRSHTPSQSVSSRTTSSTFTIPKREKSKGIVIKDPSGNVVTFDKKTTEPASVKSQSPAPASVAAAPPPPSASSTPNPPHSRSESKSGKSAEEIKAQFAESVRKTQAGEKISEEAATTASVKEDSAPAANLEGEKTANEKADASTKTADASPPHGEKQAETLVATEEAAKAEPDAEAVKASAEAAPTAAAAVAEAKPSTPETEDASAGKSAEDEAAARKAADDAEMDRMIAEMEAQEKEEEERERAYAEKKRKAAEEQAAKDKAAALNAEEELRRQEREAEALEEAREKERSQPKDEDSEEAKAESEKLFASLKKPTLGPGADGAEAASEESAPPSSTQPSANKAKPAPLKLDTVKPVEPPQPTPAMKSLKSARMLQVQTENVKYPEGIQSPNPALIKDGKRGGKIYDPAFLMQFQDVFKEKPSVDWEQKLRETIGDPSDGGASAGAKSARTPMSTRAPSGRGAPQPAFQPMGSLGQGGARTLRPGTTSQQRFEASNQNPLAGLVNRPPGGGFQMGQISMPMSRQTSVGNMSHGPSPRAGTSRRGDSKRYNAKESEKANKSMPLTANGEIKALEQSNSGWKPPSITATPSMGPDLSGHMAPDMVQRKVKAALNKMTPERFDKISEQILQIAHQSKDESDGRTLRQVIALTFEKACDEAHWASMYAKFCFRMLETMSNDIKDENILGKDGNPVAGGGLFRKYLLNRCQEEFERGWEVNLPDKKEGESEEAVMLSDEYYKAMAAKRKGLGLVQFIGELFKLRMLSIKIMHQCFLRLLDFTGMPEESTIESIVKLMRTVGGAIEQEGPQGVTCMNTYFERINAMYSMPDLPSRMHFMLLDVLDLRKSGWRSKDDAKGPKTIQEIREEAAAQQAADLARQQASRSQGRIPSNRGGGFPGQMPPPDYPRNTVGTDELRKLNMRQTSRQTSSGPARSLGPSTMFSRSASGRQGLGPGMSGLGKSASGSGDSRSASKKDESSPATASSNAFSALAGLQGESTTEKSPVSSPPLSNATPATEKAEGDAA